MLQKGRAKTAFFSICSKNYLHFARVWANSAKQQHPDIDIFLCLADENRGDISPSDEPFEIVEAKDLRIEAFPSFAFRYDIMEFNTAVKPYMISYLFSRSYEFVVYFDPDIRLYGPLTEVLDLLSQGATTVLTPHGLTPNESDEPPNDLTFLRSGIYNLGFIALRNTSDVRRLVSWWERRLARLCYANKTNEGLFVDQKWIDLWPAYCPDVAILRHPGYNVAYWNLDNRKITRKAGRFLVNREPLIFFHFSGLKPGERSILSKHQFRLSPKSLGAARSLFDAYHDDLDRNGRAQVSAWPYAYGAFANGVRIPNDVRRLFRESLEPFPGDPFSSDLAVFNAPADIPHNAEGVVSRLSHHLWCSRNDLRQAFNLKDASSQVQFSHWFVTTGRREADLPEEFVEPVRERIARVAHNTVLQSRQRQPRMLGRVTALAARGAYQQIVRVVPHLRGVYRHVSPATRRKIMHWLITRGWPEDAFVLTNDTVSQEERLATTLQEGPKEERSLEDGVVLIGYPFAETGVGEALRMLGQSMLSVSVPMAVYNFDFHVRARQSDRRMESHATERLSRAVNVFCVNADMLGETTRILGPQSLSGRYNIVRPFWELSLLPKEWIPSLERMDEIWAPTEFVQSTFASVVDKPVIHIPVAISFDSPKTVDRRRFRLPRDQFLFLFAFDTASYSARKNPGAVIDAFHKAFGKTGARDVGLVVKVMGSGDGRKVAVAELHLKAKNDRRIHIIDETLPRDEMIHLIAACDAFVSLHRSEGFGFGLAEAMYLGKPVVGTDYSGTKDFLSEQTGYPVPYELVPVREGEYPYYLEGQMWANPDVGAAARRLVEIYENQKQAQAVGRTARQFVHERHSPEAVGLVIRARLRELGLLSAAETAAEQAVA